MFGQKWFNYFKYLIDDVIRSLWFLVETKSSSKGFECLLETKNRDAFRGAL